MSEFSAKEYNALTPTYSGLSATIGEPEAFNLWLESVQKAHGFKHTFINHPHRYSHLRKFYYTLQKQEKGSKNAKFEGIYEHQSTQRMKFLHPITMLSFGTRAIPPDLSLEACDTFLLYQALKASDGSISPEDLQRLQPTVFFADVHRLLRQEDIIRYETELKAVVSKLITSEISDGFVFPLKLVTEKLSDPQINQLSDLQLNAPPHKSIFRSQLIHLIADLNAQGDLVCIHIYSISNLNNLASHSRHYYSALIAPTANKCYIFYCRN